MMTGCFLCSCFWMVAVSSVMSKRLHNVASDGHAFSNSYVHNVHQCYSLCLTHVDCDSINYDVVSRVCQLFKKDVTSRDNRIHRKNSIYIDDVRDGISGGGRPCNKCNEENIFVKTGLTKHLCLRRVDCGELRNTSKTLVTYNSTTVLGSTLVGSTLVGSIAVIRCVSNPSRTAISTCQNDATWSEYNLTCTGVKCGLADKKQVRSATTGSDATNLLRWDSNHCQHTPNEGGVHWWIIDMQTLLLVTNVFINKTLDLNVDRLSNISIHVIRNESEPVSVDNMCANYSTSVGVDVAQQLLCRTSLYGRYVRITVHSNKQLSLCNLDVCGRTSRCGLSLHKPANQSSTKYDLDASKAVDGDNNTRITTSDPSANDSCTHTVSSQLHHWWYVDLVQEILVTSVFITNRATEGDRLSNFNIHVLKSTADILGNGNLCLHKTEAVGQGQTEELVCTRSVVGRYVNITKDSRKSLTLCEVDVCGISTGTMDSL